MLGNELPIKIRLRSALCDKKRAALGQDPIINENSYVIVTKILWRSKLFIAEVSVPATCFTCRTWNTKKSLKGE
jgi:hypothetical protein